MAILCLSSVKYDEIVKRNRDGLIKPSGNQTVWLEVPDRDVNRLTRHLEARGFDYSIVNGVPDMRRTDWASVVISESAVGLRLYSGPVDIEAMTASGLYHQAAKISFALDSGSEVAVRGRWTVVNVQGSPRLNGRTMKNDDVVDDTQLNAITYGTGDRVALYDPSRGRKSWPEREDLDVPNKSAGSAKSPVVRGGIQHVKWWIVGIIGLVVGVILGILVFKLSEPDYETD